MEAGGAMVVEGIKWEMDSQDPEVICGVDDTNCVIFPHESSRNDSNVIVPEQYQFQDSDVFGIQVAEEEVISDVWDGAEVVADVGGEEVVGEMEVTYNPDPYDDEDVVIPLPQDQDTYTTMRPYPCDFCSRRFRKKANLMNHMVAHQTDRPHGCNLCGLRYRRKCDLINHMKIHAYAPGRSAMSDDDDDDIPLEQDSNPLNKGRRKKAQSAAPRKRKHAPFARSSQHYDYYNETSTYKESKPKNFSNSRKKLTNNNLGNSSHSYVDEDMKLVLQSPSFVSAELPQESREPVAPRWPVLDESRPYVCQHCGVGFAREKALASHARVHAGDSPFECNTCGEMFWDVGLLREHSRNKHARTEDDIGDEQFGDFHCETCGLGFHRQDLLKRHRRAHVKVDPGELSCQVCGQSFSDQSDLMSHAESHARFQPHRCMLCGECFSDGPAVAAHVRRRHAKSIPANACTLCGKTCKDRRSLQKHSWVHSADRSFSCHKCGKRFHSRARLKRHMVSHRDKAVTCDECGEEFPDGRALINHRHSHNKDSSRQFSCLECGKTFGSRSSQQIHARIHTGERPYGCRFCWKAFADGGTLRKHERIHTGEKPYACVVCPRAFNQRVVLREHIRSHHSGPDKSSGHSFPAVYSCKVCSASFGRSDELCAHLIKHSDENTAKHRLPRMGPRKYKRRRKLNPSELHRLSASDRFGSLTESSEEEEVKRKITKKRYKGKSQSASNDNLESVVKTFESVVENFNSIVGHSNSKPDHGKSDKKKHKLKGRSLSDGKYPNNIDVNNSKTGAESTLPNFSSGGFVKSTRPLGEARSRPRTKNVSVSTLAALKAVSSKQEPDQNSKISHEMNRVRPRTKNVNFYNVRMAKLAPATFPESEENEDEDHKPVIEESPPEVKPKPVPRKSKTLRSRRTRAVKRKNVRNRKVSENNKMVDHITSGVIPSIKEETSDNVEYTCEMCSERFPSRSELLTHVPIHI